MSDYSACAVTASYNLACLASVGGLRKVYIFTDVTGTTETAGEITTIDGSGSAYTYELRKNGGSSLTETINNSLENGSLFYQQDLVMVFHKLDTLIRNQIKLLAQNRGIRVVVEDNNGQLFFLGEDFDGGYLSAGTAATGVAFGDSSQYSITLSFFQRDPMMKLADTLANTVQGITIVA
tara:strand:+ start:55 stop:591 length:537 start_codon:yes stop_codon:yes gene_type:complete